NASQRSKRNGKSRRRVCSKASRAASIGDGSTAGWAGVLIGARRDYPIKSPRGAKGPLAPSGSGAPEARRVLGGTVAERQPHLHLLLQPMDEALGEEGIVVRGPERLAPLSRGQPVQPLARPADVVGRDLVVELLVAPARVVEPHVPVLAHALDETLAFERLDVVARARERGRLRLAEGGAEVLHDVERAGAADGPVQGVDRGVLVQE